MLIGLSEEHEYLVDQIIENLPKLKQLQLFLPDNAQGHEMAGKIRTKKSRKIKLANGITDDKNALQDLKCARFDAIIISHTASYEIGKEDIESIRAIIILREFLDHQPDAPHLIAEMRVGKNKDITSAAANSDFVVSEKIGSKVFAQFIENPHLQTVIDNLICSSNHHIRLIETPASAGLKQMRFGEIGAELLEHQRILIGWSYAVGDGEIEPFINPGMSALVPENCTKLSLVVIEKSGTRRTEHL